MDPQVRALLGADKLRKQFAKPLDTPADCRLILDALAEFMECVRYLNTRRSEGAKLTLASEADVQDAIYLMLRLWVRDLVYENPTDKTGNRFVIKDFLAPSARTVIEAKYVRDAAHGKKIAQELHDDIETYWRHPKCDNIIFFVYDPNSLIPDGRALERDIQTPRTFGGKTLQCFLLIRP